MSISLRPHGLQHARPPCPSPTPGVHPNPCPLSQWCHPTISSSVIPFSCLQSFSASGSFPMSQLFASGGQNIEVSASASVLPMNIQDWFPLGWTGWISLQSKGLSRVFSNTTVQKHQGLADSILPTVPSCHKIIWLVPRSFQGFIFLIYFLLFIWLPQVLVVACKLLVATCGIYFPDQGSNQCLLHWESRILATGPPERSSGLMIYLEALCKWLQAGKNLGWAWCEQLQWQWCYFDIWSDLISRWSGLPVNTAF